MPLVDDTQKVTKRMLLRYMTIVRPGGTQCLEGKMKGKIAGLEPASFITFATSHLGSRFHKQIPIFGASHAFEKMAYHISWIAGRIGKHLFLKDHVKGRPPLVLQMANDYGDLRFMLVFIIKAMIRRRNRVSWERTDVSFCKSKQRFFAHSTIQVKTYSINSDADVIYHMIANFVL